ncbi:hypothetical protein GFY24_07640 [Nocardia sp. SYP-A9097]|uniref:alpha/beta fold hydrolase n=1 Tax=Nocardia sp. SYP-A9097 TaxID=2663237 RepID=UPI00129AF196|nr:alpha/beta fold hydrolase [Nocardia sp. SYP-A9097]MRH87335.1 hypothetical protein [Nocardia sp. SYP-A9097]
MNLTELTADAISVIEGLSLHKPHVVGQGLGGMVALRVAAWRPDLIASVTTIAASAGTDEHSETIKSLADHIEKRGVRGEIDLGWGRTPTRREPAARAADQVGAAGQAKADVAVMLPPALEQLACAGANSASLRGVRVVQELAAGRAVDGQLEEALTTTISDPGHRIAWDMLALGAPAHDLGLPTGINSEVLPQNLLRWSPQHR